MYIPISNMIFLYILYYKHVDTCEKSLGNISFYKVRINNVRNVSL